MECNCNHLKEGIAVSGTRVVGALRFASEKQGRRRKKEGAQDKLRTRRECWSRSAPVSEWRKPDEGVQGLTEM